MKARAVEQPDLKYVLVRIKNWRGATDRVDTIGLGLRIKTMPIGADHRSFLSRRMHPPLQIIDLCNADVIEEELPLPDTNLKLRVSSADGAHKRKHRAGDNLKQNNRVEVVFGVHRDRLSLGSLHGDACAQQEHVCTFGAHHAIRSV